MSGYFKSIYGNVVLKFDSGFDIHEMKKHAEYTEVTEKEYNEYKALINKAKLKAASDAKKEADKEMEAVKAEIGGE